VAQDDRTKPVDVEAQSGQDRNNRAQAYHDAQDT
jgi:hypothetical protein